VLRKAFHVLKFRTTITSFLFVIVRTVNALIADSDRDEKLIAKVFPCDVQPLISLKIIKE